MSVEAFDRPSLARDMSPLHILTITPFFPHAGNPVYGTYVSEPLELFSQTGQRSTVIGVSPLHHKRREPLPGGASEWMRYPSLPGNAGLSSAGFFLYYRLLPFVRQLNRRARIDVIHAHAALPCGHAASLLAERLHVPFVVTVHGLDVFNTCSMSGAGANSRARRSAHVYGRAASVVCISRSVEKILQQGMPTPVRSCIIHNGVDPEVFSPAEGPVPAQPPKILSVGNLIPTKGQDIILRAAAQVATSFPDLRVEIIGEGPERERLSDLARSLGTGERISFLGRQGREAVAKAMRECTIFALPSRFEG
ncbi:MAG: glycosyltransferase, partial [Mycobacterium sp.]